MPCGAQRRKRGLCRIRKQRWPILRAMSDKVYPAFAGVLGGHKPVIKVRSMTSRWGVCFMAKRQITFALQLYHMPPAAQIYVVVHEYCHFFAVEPQPGLLGRGGKAAAGLESPAGAAEKIIYRKNGGKFSWKTKKRPAINIPSWPAIL